MSSLWIVSTVLQWIVIAGLVVIVLSLVRQLGVLMVRLNPSAGLDLEDGPGPGTEISAQDIELFPTGHGVVGGARPNPQLIVFLSPDCSLCTTVAGCVRAIARTYRAELDLLVVVHGTPRLVREFTESHGLDGLDVALRQHFPAGAWLPASTPFSIGLTDEGTVAARGTPNALEHLEEMIRSARDGLPLGDGASPVRRSWGDALPLEGSDDATVGHAGITATVLTMEGSSDDANSR